MLRVANDWKSLSQSLSRLRAATESRRWIVVKPTNASRGDQQIRGKCLLTTESPDGKLKGRVCESGSRGALGGRRFPHTDGGGAGQPTLRACANLKNFFPPSTLSSSTKSHLLDIRNYIRVISSVSPHSGVHCSPSCQSL